MKKIVVACALAALALLAAGTPSYAAESLLDGFIKTFSKQGVILELRALPDGSYDLIMLKGDKVIMNKIKGKENYLQTPLTEYDIPSLKKLTAGVGKAQNVYASSKVGKSSKGTIIAVTLRPKEGGGGYEFLVHASFPKPDAYRKSFIVNAQTWELTDAGITLEVSPRTGFWSKEEQQANSTDIEAVKPVSTSASAASGGNDGRRGGGRNEAGRRGPAGGQAGR